MFTDPISLVNAITLYHYVFKTVAVDDYLMANVVLLSNAKDFRSVFWS